MTRRRLLALLGLAPIAGHPSIATPAAARPVAGPVQLPAAMQPADRTGDLRLSDLKALILQQERWRGVAAQAEAERSAQACLEVGIP